MRHDKSKKRGVIHHAGISQINFMMHCRKTDFTSDLANRESHIFEWLKADSCAETDSSIEKGVNLNSAPADVLDLMYCCYATTTAVN